MNQANPFSNDKEKSGKKFVASFSSGKDSTLAIYRCIQAKMVPVNMITTCPLDVDRSWFHKVSQETLKEISESINIPIDIVKTSGEEYKENFEKALLKAKSNGADYAVFGDIDIEGHLDWCTKRCEAVGLKPFFPLWQEPREKIAHEFIDCGFLAKIVFVKDGVLSKDFLGKTLTHELLDEIAGMGIDACGENGEYHTQVYDGPIFLRPIIGERL